MAAWLWLRDLIIYYSRRRESREYSSHLRLSVWLCLSVCSHDKTKSAETETPNLAQGTSRYLAHQWILGQKVKGQGHVVRNAEGDRMARVSYTLYRVTIVEVEAFTAVSIAVCL